MVLTRAALRKMDKEEMILLHKESHGKSSEIIAQLRNQFSELTKILSMMKQASYNISNKDLNKRITTLIRQCWKKSQYARRKCTYTEGIPYDTYEQKVCEFLNLATRASLNPNCLKACHPLPPEGKNIIFLTFQKGKMQV